MSTSIEAGGTIRRRSTRTRRPVNYIEDQEEQAAAIISTSASFKNKKKRRTKRVSLLKLPIYNLPDAVLIHISSFVENASKVLLAVALTASSDAIRKSNYDIKPCNGARAILNQRISWFNEAIDFTKTDKELADRLSDEDVGGVLACVGDIFEIANVKLTHCINVTGRCLEPLRGSKTLQKLDLSLVNRDRLPIIHPESKIAKADVIPILDSIIDVDGFSLKHIQFPKRWREEQSQMLGRFLTKYNRIINEEGICCESCDEICIGSADRPWISKKSETCGVYNYTCYSCLFSYCGECAEENIPDIPCEKCETRQCNDCCMTMECDYCHQTTCHDCTLIDQCSGCSQTTCRYCRPVILCHCCEESRCVGCVDFHWCDVSNCYNSNCAECSDEHHGCVKPCQNCETKYCGEDLLKRFINDSEEFCSDCESRAALNLSGFNAHFRFWVEELEEKYSVKGRDYWSQTGDNFSQAMEAREELHQRCNAVGMMLLPKQKQFERFDSRLASYEYLLW